MLYNSIAFIVALSAIVVVFGTLINILIVVFDDAKKDYSKRSQK